MIPMMRLSQACVSVLAISVLLACDRPKPQGESPGSESGAQSAPSGVSASKAAKVTPLGAGSESAPAAPASVPAGAFEGVIEMKMTDPSKKPGQEFSLRVKDQKLRMEPRGALSQSSQGAYAILDLKTRDLITVAPAQKTAMRMNFAQLGPQLAQWMPAQQKSGAESITLKKLGTHQTVAGRSCEDWAANDAKGTKQSLCVTQLGANWFRFPAEQLPLDQKFAAELFDGSHFPLKIEMQDPKKGTTTIEVTTMTEAKLPASDFEVPPDYRVMDMSKLLGGMAGMMGGLPAGSDSGSLADIKLPDGVKIPPEAAAMIEKMKARAAATEKAAAEKKAQ